MIRISNKEIIDIIKLADNKVIMVEKIPLDTFGKFKADYFVLNLANGSKEAITKNAYLLWKFGDSNEEITNKITNYVQCDSIIFPSKNVFVIFPNGQSGYFNEFGEMKWNGILNYNGNYCSSATEDAGYFWTCCPNENCVIRYTADTIKLDLRIGGKDSATFNTPIFASSDDSFVYICNSDGRIRTIDKKHFTVSDIKGVYPNLRKFYKYGRYSIICTADGTFMDKN